MPRPTKEEAKKRAVIALRNAFHELQGCEPEVDEAFGDESVEARAIRRIISRIEDESIFFGIHSLDELDVR